MNGLDETIRGLFRLLMAPRGGGDALRDYGGGTCLSPVRNHEAIEHWRHPIASTLDRGSVGSERPVAGNRRAEREGNGCSSAGAAEPAKVSGGLAFIAGSGMDDSATGDDARRLDGQYQLGPVNGLLVLHRLDEQQRPCDPDEHRMLWWPERGAPNDSGRGWRADCFVQRRLWFNPGGFPVVKTTRTATVVAEFTDLYSVVSIKSGGRSPPVRIPPKTRCSRDLRRCAIWP
jgi:hypothetical protein